MDQQTDQDLSIQPIKNKKDAGNKEKTLQNDQAKRF